MSSIENNSPALSTHDGGFTLSQKLDVLGITASVACAVHCLIAPFLFLLLPAFGSVWSHPAAHWILAALILPLALLVIYRGYRIHRRRAALIAAGLGAALIVAGLLIPLVDTETVSSASTQQSRPPAAGASSPVATNSEFGVDTCCPSVTIDPQTGAASLNMPPASIVTLIGSVLLVTAHGINLHGCRCFRRDSQSTDCSCA